MRPVLQSVIIGQLGLMVGGIIKVWVDKKVKVSEEDRIFWGVGFVWFWILGTSLSYWLGGEAAWWQSIVWPPIIYIGVTALLYKPKPDKPS